MRGLKESLLSAALLCALQPLKERAERIPKDLEGGLSRLVTLVARPQDLPGLGINRDGFHRGRSDIDAELVRRFPMKRARPAD